MMVILPATILSETLCIYTIDNITAKIESRMYEDIYPESKLAEYYESAKLALSIDAAILYVVNGTVLTYLWLHMINMYYSTN